MSAPERHATRQEERESTPAVSDPITGYRITVVDALARLERIADIVDDLAYAVGCGLEGTRTAKNIREAVNTLRAVLRRETAGESE